MKNYLKIAIIFIALFVSSHSHAGLCTASGATVERLFQYDDGSIFVVLDKDTNCNCSHTKRVGFHKDDNEKFFMSAGLTALTTGKLVTIRAEDTGCSIHGNTAKLIGLYINK